MYQEVGPASGAGPSWNLGTGPSRPVAAPPSRHAAATAGTPPKPAEDIDPAALVDLVEQPLMAPVNPRLSWSWVHNLTQTPPDRRHPAEAQLVARIRRTAPIQRGTRMTKLLSGRQVGSFLRGRLISGFCHRTYDLAELRTADELALLTTDGAAAVNAEPVVFGLRWRAVDPSDYAIPFSVPVDDLPIFEGLVSMRPHERVGPPVLGTGFAPSNKHVVPEFITADFADIPLTANTSIAAYTADGTEVMCYQYLPEQRAWTRMFGPQWRHLFAGSPDVATDQEYVAVSPDKQVGARLIGSYQEDVFEAVADPPHEYRVLARVRAARYPVEEMARRVWYAHWRGASFTVVRGEGDWLRLRLCRPDERNTTVLAAQCVERGVYELWAPLADVELREVDYEYDLT
jgi:hypothetical protein